MNLQKQEELKREIKFREMKTKKGEGSNGWQGVRGWRTGATKGGSRELWEGHKMLISSADTQNYIYSLHNQT